MTSGLKNKRCHLIMGGKELAECRMASSKIRSRLPDKANLRRLASMMKLLSHPTRLQILKVLLENDACVCVLSDVVGRSQPNISQHLAKLKDGGVIADYSIGKFVFYRIADSRVKGILSAL